MTVTLKDIIPNCDEAEVVNLIAVPGSAVEDGEELLELTTDKAAFMVESPAAGVLNRFAVDPGDTLRPDDTVFELEEK